MEADNKRNKMVLWFSPTVTSTYCGLTSQVATGPRCSNRIGVGRGEKGGRWGMGQGHGTETVRRLGAGKMYESRVDRRWEGEELQYQQLGTQYHQEGSLLLPGRPYTHTHSQVILATQVGWGKLSSIGTLSRQPGVATHRPEVSQEVRQADDG